MGVDVDLGNIDLMSSVSKMTVWAVRAEDGDVVRDNERSGSLGSPLGNTPGGQKGQSGSQNKIQGEPHPSHPGVLLGPGGFPDVHFGGGRMGVNHGVLS